MAYHESDTSSSSRSGDPDGVTSRHLRRARAGDAEALEHVVRRLSPLLLAQAAYRLKALPDRSLEPADLVADVWLAVLPRLGRIEPTADGRITPAVLGYAGVAMRRRVRDLLASQVRRRFRVARQAGDDPAVRLADDAAGVITRAVAAERRSAVLTALDELSPDDRELIVLRGIEQTPTRDVAAVMGLSTDVVKQRYRRALGRLRESLPGSPFDELD